ncbi:MAG: four helix bundle protein [Candidatus Kapabacteria bacterium]|nr:four helix bundle protein [Candidatus Kapabacteria bacterium]
MIKFVRKEDLDELTKVLVDSLDEFSRNMPNDEVYSLKTMIHNSAITLPETVATASQMGGKFGAIRGILKINSNLDECINYLTLVERLKLSKTEDLIKQVNDYSRIVNQTFSSVI